MSRALDPTTHWLRRLAYAGARYGPTFWVKHSPPLFGAIFAAALSDERRQVRANLRLVLGERSILPETRDVLKTFAQYASCLAESLAAEREDAKHARIRTTGEEHLRSSLAEGRGVVVVTAHAGAWDCAARLLAAEFKSPMLVVMEAEPDAGARALQDEVRRRSGIEVLLVGAGELSALPLLKRLKAGGVVAFQLDRSAPSGRSLPVELFGRRASVPEGPFRVAAISGAPLVPIFAHRAGYFEYEFRIGPSLFLPKRPSPEELQLAAARAATEMERFIRRHPTEWFQFGDLRTS